MSNVPEIVERVLRYTGKKRNEVGNPYITARETIELANWIFENCDTIEKSDLLEYANET